MCVCVCVCIDIPGSHRSTTRNLCKRQIRYESGCAHLYDLLLLSVNYMPFLLSPGIRNITVPILTPFGLFKKWFEVKKCLFQRSPQLPAENETSNCMMGH